MKRWDDQEVAYLRENYSSKTNRELQIFLKRSLSGIDFQAGKLGLKKKREIKDCSSQLKK